MAPSLYALPRQLELRLLALAAEVLQHIEQPPLGALVFPVLSHGGAEVQLMVQPDSGTLSPSGTAAGPVLTNPLAAFLFDRLELQIVDLVATSPGALSAKGIGRRLKPPMPEQGGQANPGLRKVLSRLREVGVLSNDEDGYHLTPEFAPLLHTVLPPVPPDEPD
jgi:hypothetical protein